VPRPTLALVTALLAIGLLTSRTLWGELWLNLGAAVALRAVALPTVGNATLAETRLERAAAAGQARANWTLGMLAASRADEAARQAAQAALIYFDPDRIGLLAAAQPDDATLAALAAARYPDHPQALAWRAGQLTSTDPEQAVHLFKAALSQNPRPYTWWLGLGAAYEALGDYDAALTAYNTGCARAIGILPCHARRLLLRKMDARR
jgi:cytochrome c-type biogenesis protein CcmH/NrfG